MKRKLTALVLFAALIISLFALSACVKKGGDEKVEPKIIKYEDIYKNEPVRSEPLTGPVCYKASYGYTLSAEQGFNNFYYRYKSDGIEKDMSFASGAWSGGGATLENGYMTSTGEADAIRSFAVPVTGRARVYGNPYLTDGEEAEARITLDGRIIRSGILNDEIGLYHSDVIELTRGQRLNFEVSGSARVYWNPTVDYTLSEEKSLHHTVDGYYGDVHPFYDEKSGKLYMYYLSTGRQSGTVTEQFTSLLATSSDFVRFEDTQIRPDSKNPPEQNLYYVLGVYKDKDGNYRSSYGYGNYAGATLSTDLINWQTGSEIYIDDADGLLKYTFRAYFDSDVVSGRDPDVLYDAQSEKYYCVVMNYYSNAAAAGPKSLALYTAGSDGRFSTKAVKLLDFTGRGDPECPQLKRIGDRWYLFYSVYGTGSAGNVGNLSYRVGDPGVSPDKVDWNSKTEYALDGGDLHAAQLCQVGGMYYMYGWINYEPHTNVWGGYLNLAREVYQKADGTLGSRCDSYLTRLLNKGRVALFSSENTRLTGMSVSDGEFEAVSDGATATLNGEYGRSLLFADIQLPNGADRAGYTLSAGGFTYFVGVERSGGRLYLTVTDLASGNGSRIEIRDASQTQFQLKIIADNNFIEAFVNDEYSLSANTRLSGGIYTLGLSCSEGAVLTDAEVCKLADYNNIYD